ncbi:TolC family protein [Candidatus Sulfurimonas marisnigri]|uniref:TolC family protein n=1 Tax=Candidatus Sulfurimonas marisnigri TaxID=2740405 RepID=A0A7S7LZP0_9BACT|nr:TolC family protein [Candidatus Sulfurimonas marisnigri]QOY54215.1 TolC family protein [Candidatus Sulfurimonas marisnigri]
MIKKQTLLLSVVLATSLYAQSVTLDEAIAIALENNKQLRVSDISLKIADTLYNQAMSAHYPTLDVSVTAMRLDEAPTFEMRGLATVDNTGIKNLYSGLGGAYTTLGATAGAVSADSGTLDLATQGTLNAIAASATTTGTQFSAAAAAIPDQGSLPIDMEVQMMGRDTVMSQIDFMLPLYTGGKITAITEQAKIGKAISQEGVVRTRNQVIYDVKKYYYGVVLAKRVEKLASDTLERMSFTRDLTSQLYQGGSMKVKKTDYLRSKMSVNMIEVFYEDIKSKVVMAKAALANAMGYSWEKEIDATDDKLPAPVMDKSMKMMVQKAYEFNPDYKTLKLAIKVQDAKIDEAQSGYLPQVAFVASAQHMYNDYEYGVINDTNKNSWSIGVGVQWSLFNGMRTTNQVQQSRLEKLKMQEQEILLQDGLALQIKQAYLEMQSTYNKYKVLVDAVEVAKENRDLNTRAYQEDMVETKDVIESQLFEALTEADFYRCQNDYALARAKSDLIVGNAIEDSINK